jgi:hypothetical protein
VRVDLELDNETVTRVLGLLGGDAVGLSDPTIIGHALEEVINTGLVMIADEIENPKIDPADEIRASQRRIADLEDQLEKAEKAKSAIVTTSEDTYRPGDDIATQAGVSERDAEEIMLSLASVPRVDSSTVDDRGVVQRVWFPQDDTWSDIERMSEAFHDIDYYIYLVLDRTRSDPRLRTFVSSRMLPTNERVDEIMCASPVDDIDVIVNIKGKPWRFRIDRSQAMVIGKIVGKPTPVSK